MTAKNETKARSRILDAVHTTAASFHDAGLIEAEHMREYDALCLPATPTEGGEASNHFAPSESLTP